MTALLTNMGGQSTALLTDALGGKEGKHGFLMLYYDKTDDESDTIFSTSIVVYIRGLYTYMCAFITL